MPSRGRPRLTEDDLRARIATYCSRYRIASTGLDLPPFPAGKRETAQHREWIGLYKLHDRLGRRARGQCERCTAPASAGSIFCETHRSVPGDPGLPADERARLLAAQRTRCPACAKRLEPEGPLARHPEAGPARALAHPACAQLLRLAEAAGPQALERVRSFLWP